MEVSTYLAMCLLARYMEISVYFATKRIVSVLWHVFPCTCFVKGKQMTEITSITDKFANHFQIGKINKIRVVSCQEKAASYILFTN